MRKLAFILLFFIFCGNRKPLATTWAATASNELVSIAAWNDFQPSYPISGTSTKAITKAQIAASGVSSIYYENSPMAELSSSRCPTKWHIESTQ